MVCQCPGSTCVAGDATISETTGGGCTTLDLVIADSNTIGLEVVNNRLRGNAVVDPDDNTMQALGNGLYVPMFAASATDREEAWTEVRIGDNKRHVDSITLPTGTWFIIVSWSGWIQKRNLVASDAPAETTWRISINDEFLGHRKRWRWGNTTGILGEDDTRATAGDSYAHEVILDRTTDVEIALMTGINNSGAFKFHAEYHASRLSTMAIRREDA